MYAIGNVHHRTGTPVVRESVTFQASSNRDAVYYGLNLCLRLPEIWATISLVTKTCGLNTRPWNKVVLISEGVKWEHKANLRISCQTTEPE